MTDEQRKAAYRESVSSVFEAGPVETDGPKAEHTPTPWYHRQAGQKSKYGEAYDWIADSPERGKHRKIIVSRDGCEPADYAFIVEAVNNYESLRAQLATARKALEDEVRYAEAGTPKKFLEKSLSYRAGVWQRLRAALSPEKPGERKI